MVIDLTGKSDIADYMVIATGRSSRQVAAMADRLVQVVKSHGIKGTTPEGVVDRILDSVGSPVL